MIRTPNKIEWTWIIGFTYFNLMDAFLTLLGINYLGVKEINPIMKIILDNGVLSFIAFKMCIGALATFYFVKKELYKSLRLITFLVAGVVGWNIIVMSLKLFLNWSFL
jgi:hypothetical protein